MTKTKPNTDVPRVLLSLLYGRFSWLQRLPDGTLIFPLKEAAEALQMQIFRVKLALEKAEERGLLEHYLVRSAAVAKLKVPEGFERGRTDNTPA